MKKRLRDRCRVAVVGQSFRRNTYGGLGLLSCLILVIFTACSSTDLSQTLEPVTTFRVGYLTVPNAELVAKRLSLVEERFPQTLVKWVRFDSGYAVNVAMRNGEIDVGMVGSVPAATGIARELPIQVYFIHDVIGDNEALAVAQSSGIKAVADMSGKKIAAPFGSTTHFGLLSALEKEEIEGVSIVDMRPGEIRSAWERGAIDGAFVWQPVLSALVKAKGEVLLTARDLAEEGIVTADVGIVRPEFAAAHPDFLTDYVAVLDEAVKIYRKDPMMAAEAVALELGLSPEESLRVMDELIWLDAEEQSSMEYLGSPEVPGEFAQVLKRSAEFMLSQKAIPSVPDLAVFQAGVTNSSIAQVANLGSQMGNATSE